MKPTDKTKQKNFQPDKVLSYFKEEWVILLAVTVSGLIYNIGLLAGPWFEGKMAGCLADILGKRAVFADMFILAGSYVLTIAVVQISRYIKRFYVRRFANNINRQMKQILYASLVHKSRRELKQEGAGDIMTKAILDVDDCVEGMRKFTTEIFDTGVALAAYAGMLLYYDLRLALLGMLFIPVSYYIAQQMKKVVQRTGAAYKVQSGALSTATLDRASNAVTYRVYGCEKERQLAYEENLNAYESAAVKANIWSTSMQPLYRIISMTGILFLLYFGSKNVLGRGWTVWDIATFTTFLSCFIKLSVKSSSAAKLFNSVHKAQVSWKRIKPLMKMQNETDKTSVQPPAKLEVLHAGFAYPGSCEIFRNISFSAEPGQIIGVTGAVASGKSTFGKMFLCEYQYKGSIRFAGTELAQMPDYIRTQTIGYLGHDPELFDDSVENNILLGDENCKDKPVDKYLKAVCLDKEISEMRQKEKTIIGDNAVRLSGGQAQRLALARTLFHKRPVIILDDPFSALDRDTEQQVFENMKKLAENSIVILLTHRLYLFPQMNRIIWMENRHVSVGTHEELLRTQPEYAKLYAEQEGGNRNEEQ